MLGHEPRILGLLPALGVCSCVAAEAATTTPGPSGGAAAPALIEQFEREPLTIPEALIRSGRESLAAGHYRAAYSSLRLAVEQEPARASELHLDMIDAVLGLGDFTTAETLIAQAREASGFVEHQQLQRRVLLAREIANARGLVGCEAKISSDARPLIRAADPFAAWNALRSGLPAEHAIPIPTSEAAAREALCPDGCATDEPSVARLDGDNEATLAVVIAHADGSFSMLPDLLHPVAASCEDETLIAVERVGGLVRMRAFADLRESIAAEDWHLVELPEYGTPPVSAASSPSYASSSSGYQYQNQNQYQYQYAYYGCGGYHDYGYEYDYDTCEVQAHVERDIVLDVERGEIVLDIVRSGSTGAALGRVRMTAAPSGPIVDVEACGVTEQLRLTHS